MLCCNFGQILSTTIIYLKQNYFLSRDKMFFSFLATYPPPQHTVWYPDIPSSQRYLSPPYEYVEINSKICCFCRKSIYIYIKFSKCPQLDALFNLYYIYCITVISFIYTFLHQIKYSCFIALIFI